MIQKRFQYWSNNGMSWTEWFDFCNDDTLLEKLQAKGRWQLAYTLRNEYRKI